MSGAVTKRALSIGGAVAVVASTLAAASPALAHTSSPKLTTRPAHVPPAPSNKLHRHGSKPLARATAWDPSRQVDAVAYCTQSGGAWAFGAAVLPTVAGNQSIAFRFNVFRSDGQSLGSTDWWEGEVDRYGLFHEWSRAGNGLYYKFMNMRTGELYNSVGYTLYPPRGLGYRETITVYWYVNGAWSRSITVAPTWGTGASPTAFCMG